MPADTSEPPGDITIKDDTQLTCGLIMPISGIDGCPTDHWVDVKTIITEAIESIAQPKFNVKLVSDADDVGVIQKRIVHNIYNADVIVCDVSGKNPNVMFELGMRLAFDKAAVIVKDEKTEYSFDTGVIEHVQYPRDLRFNKIVQFKRLLADKVLGTYRAAKDNPDHSTFLKNFGKFQIATIPQDVVPADRAVMAMMGEMQQEVSELRLLLAREMRTAGPRSESRRFRSGTGVEAKQKLNSAILSYLLEHPDAGLTTLATDPIFVDEIEKRCEAPHYFTSRRSFGGTLREAIGEIAVPRRDIADETAE